MNVSIRISLILFKVFFCLILIINSSQSYAQFNKIKQAVSKENRQKVVSGAKGQLDKARDSFDSTDFDYAILVTDNSGLLDVGEKGEFVSKLAMGGSLALGVVDSAESKEDE